MFLPLPVTGVDIVSIKPIHSVMTFQEDITTAKCRLVSKTVDNLNSCKKGRSFNKYNKSIIGAQVTQSSIGLWRHDVSFRNEHLYLWNLDYPMHILIILAL